MGGIAARIHAYATATERIHAFAHRAAGRTIRGIGRDVGTDAAATQRDGANGTRDTTGGAIRGTRLKIHADPRTARLPSRTRDGTIAAMRRIIRQIDTEATATRAVGPKRGGTIVATTAAIRRVRQDANADAGTTNRSCWTGHPTS